MRISRGRWVVTAPERRLGLSRAAVADAAFSLSPGESSADWAKNLNREDFRLLCLDGTTKPVTEAQSCYLAVAPNHAVVSRSDRAAHVEQVLLHQQVRITGPPACAYLQGPLRWATTELGGSAHLQPFFLVPQLEAGDDSVCPHCGPAPSLRPLDMCSLPSQERLSLLEPPVVLPANEGGD